MKDSGTDEEMDARDIELTMDTYGYIYHTTMRTQNGGIHGYSRRSADQT
jgi:hypothetical protein